MKVISGADLPRIGWHGGEPLDRARFKPVTEVPIEGGDMFTKPASGGLWCSPVAYAGRVVMGTAWTERAGLAAPGQITIVAPKPQAQVAVVDGRDALRELIEAFPDDRPSPYPATVMLLPGRTPYAGPRRVAWPAAAGQVDAVYLTGDGVAELNGITGFGEDDIHLWGWDVPTVLFLRPAFTVTRRMVLPTKQRRAVHVRRHVERAVRAKAAELGLTDEAEILAAIRLLTDGQDEG